MKKNGSVVLEIYPMETQTAYLDANFYVALQIIKHPFHNTSIKILKKYPNLIVCYSILTLDEIIFSLTKYNFDKNIIYQNIYENLFDNPRMFNLPLNSNKDFLESYLQTYTDNSLKPRDAMHYFFMQQNNITNMATFDTDFIKNKKRLGIEILK